MDNEFRVSKVVLLREAKEQQLGYILDEIRRGLCKTGDSFTSDSVLAVVRYKTLFKEVEETLLKAGINIRKNGKNEYIFKFKGDMEYEFIKRKV